MRVFVTGASGWIGSAVVPELVAAGHDVVGLARSDDAAAAVTARGAEVVRGSLADLDLLAEGAAGSDAVIHLGFIHDFADFMNSVETDRTAINVMCEALAGTDRPFLFASGVAGLAPGRISTEADEADDSFPRAGAARLALGFRDRGVRSTAVRFPPTVHGDGDHGFIATLVDVARTRGASGFVGDGSNRWSAVHRLDAGRLVRLALDHESTPPVVHAIAEEGVPTATIAEAIGRHLDVPVVSIDPSDAAEHFGWIGMFFGSDAAASSAVTRERLEWEPTHPSLVDDLEAGSYFAVVGA